MTQYRIFSRLEQSAVFLDRLKWLRIGSLWAYRLLTWSVLAAGFAFAAAVLALRYWILPNIERYREDIARIASEAARQRISIGRIHASWEGLRPQLVLERVTVFDAAGRPALELSRVDNTLSWLSLVTLEPRFYALDIHRPTLSVRRDARGVISVAGIELAAGAEAGGFAQWLLRQRDIEVHDATIVWRDELRGAPPLELKRVNLQLFNRGGRHRFGLRAEPPPELAAPLDVRGEFAADTLAEAAGGSARLFLQLDYADIAAWRAWVPFPIELPRGAGALRAWLGFERGGLVEALADVQLAGVRVRLETNLPELDLAELAGRIGWKALEGGFEFTTSKLGLATADGLVFPPADFLLRVSAAGARRPARGELQANALELGALVALAAHLPLPEEARKRIAAFSPKGSLHDLAVRWNGDWREPTQYSARGRFHNLALNRSGQLPGFSGVSGSLDGNERGGTLYLNCQKARLDLPLVFREPLDFDTLTAQVAWGRTGSETELRLNNVSFSNAHLSGTVFGNYRIAGSGRGYIDLTGSLTRADARFVPRYVPVTTGKKTLAWLDTAFAAGQSNDVSLRLKGNLDEFPFPEGKGGVFQVVAKVTGGTLEYASGWPRIENIAGDLVFRGRRMDVRARQGTILGVRLARVHAEIPDLLAEQEMLHVAGEAEGPTREFLAFLEKSPVLGMIDHFTEGWRAEGTGKLTLKLAIPLAATEKSRVTGTYQFTGNTLVSDPGLPALEQASGRIEFTESTVRAQNVTGTVLGGPVTISANTARDATVRVSVQGRVNADAARRSAGSPFWAQHLRGTTDWRALYTVRKRSADVVIESNLQGLAVDLPAPLAKSASEALPFRFERRALAPGQERIALAFGEVVSMNLVRRVEDGRAAIARGVVRFGGAAGEPERSGVWVSGAVKALDLDRWLALVHRAGGDGTRVEWGGVDLKLGAVDALGRRFGEVTVSAAAQGGQWRSHLVGKGLEGSLVWQPQGRGRLVARMKTLAIPPPAPGAAQSAAAGAREKELELPALDVTAEQFVNKERVLGRLELAATPEGRDWRIERLRLVNPESALTVEGVWQGWLAQPRTQVNVRLETSDVGRLLARFGYPEGVRRGSAKLEGVLSWTGAPYDFDYPTLSGNFVLEAAKGQFVKLEPGIAKLLGVLSLQALPRRITLDFRDIFSEGFAFDEIVGAVKISRGVATTDGLRIQGPSARVTMSGEVDLARETQKIRVRITPHLSDSVSIAGALIGGPVAGVAAFLAQKVLKDPLDQLVSYEYSVTGTWSDPSVVRIERPAEGERAPEKSTP
ncbi:MAG TPA: YhdP family protein [Burkholderiales bacterium]|nr:YhdP family protein [Burkholderiales bacterium]